MELPVADSPLSQPTRARLFAAMQKLRRAASTEELARVLGLHANGVRRHLELLEASGLIERRRVSRGRGRPRDEWSIASGAGPSGEGPEAYADLAGWLARALADASEGLSGVESVGRQIGRELSPEAADAPTADAGLAEGMRQAFSALGFRPQVEEAASVVHCRLDNCPYRRSAIENPDVICTLHRGITIGLLERLAPEARLTAFEPRDPEAAGCVVEVAR